jgi:hypothetical protein
MIVDDKTAGAAVPVVSEKLGTGDIGQHVKSIGFEQLREGGANPGVIIDDAYRTIAPFDGDPMRAHVAGRFSGGHRRIVNETLD